MVKILRKSWGSISKIVLVLAKKSIFNRYIIQNVKDGIQIQVYNINNESVDHYSQFISVKAKNIEAQVKWWFSYKRKTRISNIICKTQSRMKKIDLNETTWCSIRGSEYYISFILLWEISYIPCALWNQIVGGPDWNFWKFHHPFTLIKKHPPTKQFWRISSPSHFTNLKISKF